MKLTKLALFAALPLLSLASLAQDGPGGERPTGVLLLAHGGARNWNEEVDKLASKVGQTVPLDVAYGMASKRNIQDAIDRLVARGVREIVAVPLFVSSHSSVITSTQYLLGVRPDAPPELAAYARMSHDHGAHSPAQHEASTFDPMTPVQSPVPIRMTAALDAHLLVGEILASRAGGISKDPAHETVVLVAHGPVSDEENARWLADMASLAGVVRHASNFERVEYLTVRDDAPEPIRSQATAELREVVERAAQRGKVLVVPLLISYGGIESGIRKRLEGLSYIMSPQALLPDDRLAQWVVLAAQTPLPASGGAGTQGNAAQAGRVQGQPPRSSLRGRVLDPARAPIAGARITALPGDGRASGPSIVSDQNGEFSLVLDPGFYTFRLVAEGFQEAWQTVLLSNPGSQSREFILQVAEVHQTVTVTEPAGYQVAAISSGTKTLAPLRDIPQSIAVVTQDLIRDQMMMSIGDVVRYVPGITAHQGENNRDQVIIRGNSSSADFFVNGVRDDVQYYRDLYNLDRVEALKGPNALIFGRGGGGGVINRVTKEAGFTPLREVTLLGGSYNNKRFATDFDQPFGDKVALRLNGMYENSDSFRNYVNLERYGISPTVTIAAGKQTRLTLSYEHFRDNRTADRGITSFQGRPADVPVSTFYGNPDDSHVRARVNLGSATIEHQVGGLNIRNRVHFGDYDRLYQNFVPGAVTADKAQVALLAYNNATDRLNIFNQTDLNYTVFTGRIRHTLLGGVEVGRQLTDNFRNTGYFNNTATSVLAPYANPVISTPVTFRQSATDADNHLKTNLGATYVQDQIELSRHVQVIAGLRFDHFDLQYHNNRTSEDLRRIDNLVSPRAGVVFKPITPLSIYGSYSVSYLPSSGDQFSSLTVITQQVKPEKFSNYELGVKWDLHRSLSLTTAVYRLDRTNTRSTDPNDPTRIVQQGSQRSNGFEVGASGSITRAWKIAGGYAYQDAFVTSATTAARVGAQVGQVPHNSFSLWNNYQILPRLGAGLGVLNRSDVYAAIDNTVTLPGYTRADAALFFSLTEKVRLQTNVENLLNKKYYINADSNTNISPGFSRAIRIGLTARF